MHILDDTRMNKAQQFNTLSVDCPLSKKVVTSLPRFLVYENCSTVVQHTCWKTFSGVLKYSPMGVLKYDLSDMALQASKAP